MIKGWRNDPLWIQLKVNRAAEREQLRMYRKLMEKIQKELMQQEAMLLLNVPHGGEA